MADETRENFMGCPSLGEQFKTFYEISIAWLV